MKISAFVMSIFSHNHRFHLVEALLAVLLCHATVQCGLALPTNVSPHQMHDSQYASGLAALNLRKEMERPGIAWTEVKRLGCAHEQVLAQDAALQQRMAEACYYLGDLKQADKWSAMSIQSVQRRAQPLSYSIISTRLLVCDATFDAAGKLDLMNRVFQSKQTTVSDDQYMNYLCWKLQALVALHRLKEAEEWFANNIESRPKVTASDWIRQAGCAGSLQRKEETLRCLAIANRMKKEGGDYVAELSIYQGLGMPVEVRKLIPKAFEHLLPDANGLRGVLDIIMMVEPPASVLNYAKRALAAHPHDAAINGSLAEAESRTGNFTEALRIANHLPMSPRTQRIRLGIDLRMQREKDALALLKQLQPADMGFIVPLCNTLIDDDDLAAVTLFGKCLICLPTGVADLFGACQSRSIVDPLVMQRMLLARKDHAKDPFYALYSAIVYEQRHQFAKANADIRLFFRNYPAAEHSLSAWRDHCLKGQYKKCSTIEIAQATKEYPQSAVLYAILAERRYEVGDYSGAIEALSQGLHISPHEVGMLERRARMFGFVHNYQNALSDLDLALSLLEREEQDSTTQRTEIQYLKRRSRLLLKTGAWQRAIVDLTKLIEWEPDSPEHYLDRATACQRLGHLGRAEQDRAKSLQVARKWSQ